MNSNQLLDISTQAIWVLIKISMPILLIALLVGLIISLFQALTQIQEQTLTFVPKIITILLSLLFFIPYIGSQLYELTIMLQEYIINK